jgi:hypothetical protein
VLDQADSLSRRIVTAGKDDQERVRRAFRRVFAREASSDEVAKGALLVESLRSEGVSEEDAWSALCQALLMSNEFRYVD